MSVFVLHHFVVVLLLFVVVFDLIVLVLSLCSHFVSLLQPSLWSRPGLNCDLSAKELHLKAIEAATVSHLNTVQCLRGVIWNSM